jgi:phage tail sheath protein FI
MQFVNNLNNLVVDDQYFMEITPPPSASNVPTGNIGIVGTFSRGPINTPTLVTSYPDLVKKFGEVDANFTLTGTISARGIFKQGNANVYVVRVQNSTSPATQAETDILDTSTTPQTVMTLKAATPGTWGNSLSVLVTAGTKTGTYKVSLTYGSESELWDNLIIAQPTTPIPNAVLASTVFGANGLSKLATATFPSTPVTTEWETGTNGQTYTMSGGTDGATTTSSDYVGTNTGNKTGIYALDGSPINLIFCAEQSDSTLNTALINNAQDITASGGTPRIALVTFPQNTAVSGLQTLTANLDTDRAIAVFPWLNIYDPVNNVNRVVSPLGYFAGLLAQLPPHQSPGNKAVFGILGTDPTQIIGPSDLVTMVNTRVNAIGVQTPAGQIGIRTGHTLSQNADTAPIYARRMKDYIDTKVSLIGGIYVDQPITDGLMRQVKQSIDNVLLPMKSPANAVDQMIADYRIVCDSTNNSSDSLAQNRLICDYAVKLLNINRFMIFRTQISPGVVITQQS